MTLTARREPSFDGAGRGKSHEALSSEALLHGAAGHGLGHAPKPTGILRLVSTVQIVGSLLAVPLGLASGYSIYKANFAPETTCLQLRGNIITMLDKSVDATTRRMLVKRDVEAFEQSCGAFDPDAHAAFKRLLAVDLPVAAKVPLPKAEPKVVKLEAKAEPKAESKPKAKPEAKVETKAEAKLEVKPERKAEPKAQPKVEAKAEAKIEPKIETKIEPKAEAKADPKVEPKIEPKVEQPQVAAAISDTRWVAAVRQALVKHPVPEEPPAAQLQPSWNVTPAQPAVAAQAPQLPAPQIVPAAVAPQQADSSPDPKADPAPLDVADHPVPPGSIPESQPVTERTRLGGWIAQIPFVGRVIER